MYTKTAAGSTEPRIHAGVLRATVAADKVHTYLLAAVDKIIESHSVEMAWSALCTALGDYGFDRFLYGQTRFRDGQRLGDPEDWLLLTHHDKDYVRQFIDSGMFRTSPMLLWAMENEGACSWSVTTQRLDSQTLSDEERRVFAFNQSMQVTAGYTISFRTISPRFSGALALTAERGLSQVDVDGIWDVYGHEIMALANISHLKLTGLPYDGKRKLSQRQSEVLGWVADGKSTQDIAVILGISAATVEKHLRLARQALDVETTAQALIKLAYRNQIHLLEPRNGIVRA